MYLLRSHSKRFLHLIFLLAALISLSGNVLAQDMRPDLMYFRFDETGQTVSVNKAHPATRVVPDGSITGALTMSGTGQFGSALVSPTGSGQFVTGWSTNLGSSSFTISFWLNLPANPNNGVNYLWGDVGASSFRCFEGGVAGQGGLYFRGPITDVIIPPNTIPVNTPKVIHYVYDKPANVIRAYVDGVLAVTQAQPTTVTISGSGFFISGYSSGGAMYAGTSIDEFRIYGRALTDQEIADSWNRDVDCFFPDGTMTYELLDGNLQPTTFAQVPGILNLGYSVSFPATAAPVNITLNFHNVITDAIVFTHSFTVNKLAGQTLTGIEAIPLPPSMPTGYFRVEVIFNNHNSCDIPADYIAKDATLLLLPPGAQMCVVWPGDVDNDGLVNYADRAALNKYIYDANLRSSWLNGPTRYSVVGGFDYIEWKAQPSAPWETPEGCYMDTDGNGVINNYDYIAIKLNWLRSHGVLPPKQAHTLDAKSFDMEQNFPNPFNPSTSIRYAVPERSQVRLVVTDMLGREIATLVSESVDAGVHTAQFDAANLTSGSYVAVVSMTGLESGLTFSKTMMMTLSK